ncbi:hypothetical protein K439DRAFT_1661058 [Ramaria rubella]|nr:hypothetical protein K439DRAFT_1661058 [Ramaria rubella]
MNTPSISEMTHMSSGSSVPRELPTSITLRCKYNGGVEAYYVQLPATHEEAQWAAARAFRGLIGDVDPSWLFFTIPVRVNGMRKETSIYPSHWFYATSKLPNLRVVDVHVVPPADSPNSSTAKNYAPLPSPSLPRDILVPPYPDSPQSSSSIAPPYSDSPPPRYPGSPAKKRVNIPLPPTGYGYGYGFGWHDQVESPNVHAFVQPQLYPHSPSYPRTQAYSPSALYPDPHLARHYDSYSSEQQGVVEPKTAGRRRAASGFPRSARANGLGLFSSIKQRVFPVSWNERQGGSRRRREYQPMSISPDYAREGVEECDEYQNEDERERDEHQHSNEQEDDYQHEYDYGHDYQSTSSRSGRLYVPSLF